MKKEFNPSDTSEQPDSNQKTSHNGHINVDLAIVGAKGKIANEKRACFESIFLL